MTSRLEDCLKTALLTALDVRGIRRRRLAQAAGLSPGTVSNLLHGHTHGSIEAWSALLDAAGVEIGWRLKPLTDAELDQLTIDERRMAEMRDL